MHEHRSKLLSEQIHTQHSASLMGEEHIEDAQLNDSLICAGSETVQDHGSEPLACSMKFSEPYTSAEAENCGDQKDRPSSNLHSGWNPKDVHKALSLVKSPFYSLLVRTCYQEKIIQSTTAVHIGKADASVLTNCRPCSSKGVLSVREGACVDGHEE